MKILFRFLLATCLLISSADSFGQNPDSFRLEFAPVFGLAPSGGEVFSRDYSPAGPLTGARLIPGMKVITTNARSKYYGIYYHEFHEIDAATGGIKQIAFPEGLSWPTSLTLDGQRNRILISASTQNNQGGLYAFDLEDRTWTLLAEFGSKLDSIVFDPENAVLWGYTENHSILEMDRDGKLIRQREQLSVPFQLGPSQHVSELALIGPGKVALLMEPEFGWPQSWLGEQRIYILGAGEPQLTFQRKHEGWPPSAVAPVVQITSPMAGANLSTGDDLVIKVQADDPDGTVQQVRLYEGQNFLADIKRAGDGEFVFHSIPFGPGTHRLTAQAGDSDGFISNSDLLTFSIEGGQTEEAPFGLTFWPIQGLSVGEGKLIGRRYTSAGPGNGTTLFPGMHVVADSSEDPIYYGTHWHQVYRIDPRSNAVQQMTLSGVPELSWSTGVAWDGQRGRLLLMSFGGEGYLYAYSPRENKWSVVASMENQDYFAVTYSYEDDSIYAVSQSQIVRFNLNGETVESMPMSAQLPFLSGGYVVRLISEGGRMWLLVEPGNISSGGPNLESRIYEIDFAAKQARQTYRRIWRNWPPQNTAPVATIRSPAAGATVDNARTIVLEAAVTDQDDDLQRVEFFANGQSLGAALKAGQSGTTKIFSFEWKNAPIGPARLMARATDAEGVWANSAIVTFTVSGTSPDGVFKMDFFKFLDREGTSVVTRRYAAAGPLDDMFLLPGLRIISADDAFYGVAAPNTLFRVNQATGLGEEINLAGLQPEVRGPVSITYDSRRESLVLASMGGEGFLYAFSLEDKTWTTLQDLNDHELVSLHYHFADDTLYGLAQPGPNPGAGPVLYQFDAQGQELGYISLPLLPFSLGQYAYNGEVVSSKDLLAVLLEFRTPGSQRIQESQIYMVDPRNGSVRLTYRKVWDDVPPGIPIVRIIKPTAGETVQAGVATTLEAAAWAGKTGIAEFEFLVNGKAIGSAQRGSDPASVSLGSIEWTPPSRGTHLISARVRTWDGAVVLSDSVAVTIGARPAELIRAVRNLPDRISSGQNFSVTIAVTPSDRVNAYALEDRPPQGWRVSNISHEGTFDAVTGRVKFGPYSDHELRTVTYVVTAPAELPARGLFSGTVSANAITASISGESEVQAGPGHHPADRSPTDYRIGLQEATSYAAAWKAHEAWPFGPNPIPIEFVTRASMLWRQGEGYHFSPDAAGAPHWWVPGAEMQPNRVLAAEPPGAPAVRRITGRGQGVFDITLELPTIAANSALAIEEDLPVGSVASNIGDGGQFHPDSSTIRWGPWTGSQPSVLHYRVAISGGATAGGTFSVDGSGYATAGDRTFASMTVSRTEAGLELRFEKPLTETVTLERSDKITGPWSEVRTISENFILMPEGGSGFFRLRIQ